MAILPKPPAAGRTNIKPHSVDTSSKLSVVKPPLSAKSTATVANSPEASVIAPTDPPSPGETIPPAIPPAAGKTKPGAVKPRVARAAESSKPPVASRTKTPTSRSNVPKPLGNMGKQPNVGVSKPSASKSAASSTVS